MPSFKPSLSRLKWIIRRRPLLSFYAALALLLVTIFAVAYLSKPKNGAPAAVPAPKPVTLYAIGSTSRITSQGKVEKTGLITVAAQTGGIVYRVHAKDGETVAAGQSVVELSTSYNGANVVREQLALAKTQLDFQNTTAPLQQELIGKQKESALLNAENTEMLRQISADSLNRTRDQLSLTNTILETLDKNIDDVEEATQSAATDTLILTTRQLRNQFLSARNQVQSALEQTEYQVNEDNPPSKLSTLGKEIALTQLDIQARSIRLNQEVAQINYRLAAINHSLSRPASPVRGRIEKIYVRFGQAVSPGTPLFTLSGAPETAQVVVTAPPALAERISQLETATIKMNHQEYPLKVIHVSETFSDQLSRIILSVPDSLQTQVNDQQYVTVSLPVGYPQSVSVLPVIPVDAVHQTQQGAFVFLVLNQQAVIREITLGKVVGDRVEVLEGLGTGDQVIIERNISEGDTVVVK